jgi:hypothetical protein
MESVGDMQLGTAYVVVHRLVRQARPWQRRPPIRYRACISPSAKPSKQADTSALGFPTRIFMTILSSQRVVNDARDISEPELAVLIFRFHLRLDRTATIIRRPVFAVPSICAAVAADGQ